MTSFDDKTDAGPKPNTFVDRESALEAGLPTQEKHQPDPMLQITTGHMGAGGITVVAIVSALIVGVVLYGLNSGASTERTAAAPPPPPPSSHSAKPAAGGTGGAPNNSGPRANESGAKG